MNLKTQLKALGFLAASAMAGLAIASPDPIARDSIVRDSIVVRIGDYTLTRTTFDAMWNGLQPAQRANFEQNGGPKAFLDSFVEQKLLAAEATSRGIDRRPLVAATIEATRDTILSKALLDDEVRDRVVTDAAMHEYYEQHKAGFRIPETVEMRHIMATPFADQKISNSRGDDAKTEAEAKAKIERIQKELAAGASFATLAREWSEDVTASEDGRLDAFSRGLMSKPIEDAAFSLPVGKVSDLIRTPYGFHLLLIEKRLPERQQDFDEVKERIRAGVSQDKRPSFAPRYEQFLAEIRTRIKVDIDSDALPPWTPPTPAASANPK